MSGYITFSKIKYLLGNQKVKKKLHLTYSAKDFSTFWNAITEISFGSAPILCT